MTSTIGSLANRKSLSVTHGARSPLGLASGTLGRRNNKLPAKTAPVMQAQARHMVGKP